MSPAFQVLGSIALVTAFVVVLQHPPLLPRRTQQRVRPSRKAETAMERWQRKVGGYEGFKRGHWRDRP